MMKEGVGLIAPPTITIPITDRQIQRFRDIAARREKKYYHANDQWVRGLTNEPTVRGLVGEFAVSRWLSQVSGVGTLPDFTDREHGDDGSDFVFCGRRIQVKCRSRRYGYMLVRRVKPNGSVVPMKWDNCIQTTWEETREPECSSVSIDGWVSKQTLLTSLSDRLRLAWKGTHQNLEIPDANLESLQELANHILTDMELSACLQA